MSRQLPCGNSVICGAFPLEGPNKTMKTQTTAKKANYTVSGKSGTKYTFGVYDSPGEWREVAGVYLITKRTVTDGTGSHSHIYVGETDNLKERHASHHKEDCFQQHDANCLCFLAESSEQKRRAIEADVLAGGRWPCNG